jgi:hypothetical protein
MKLDIKITAEGGLVILTFGDLATVTFNASDFIRFVRECNLIVTHLTGAK